MRKLVFATLACLTAVPAFAKVITYEYTGVVSRIFDSVAGVDAGSIPSSSVMPGSLHIGDVFHGSLSYDSALPLSFSQSSYAYYQNDSKAYEGKVPASSIVIDRSGTSIVSDPSAPSVVVSKDALYSYVSLTTNADAGSLGSSELEFHFLQGRAEALPTLAVPANLRLADFPNSYTAFSWNTPGSWLTAQGMLTSFTNVSPVPEPDAYLCWFAGAALAGAASLRKRTRNNKPA